MDSIVRFTRRIIPATETNFFVSGFVLSGFAVDLYFINGTYFADPSFVAVTDLLSISRASIGYAKTAAGTLTQFAADTLRITTLGLLVEDSRANLIFNSQDATAGSWVNFGLTSVTGDATTAPDGTTTADLITNTGTGDREIDATGPSSITYNSDYTASIYAKKNTTDWFCFGIADGVSFNVFGWFNLNTGSTGTNFTSGTGVHVSHSIEALADGWYRCIVTFQVTGTATSWQAIVKPAVNGDGISTGTSGNSNYIWGVQTEHASFASSYIPTGATSATRAADVITNIGALQTDIAAATGSIIAQVDHGESSGFAANIVDSNGTNLLGFDSTNHGLASITATLTTGNTANRTSQDKLGLAWDASGRSLVLNAGTVATDATAQTPSSTQHLGSDSSANFAFAYIERLTVWTTKLADATVQLWTSP